MTSNAIANAQAKEDNQSLSQSYPILAAHFVHDVYAAMVAPLLPLLIEKLSLSLTAAGSLNAVMQLPGILNPLIGYIADRSNIRYFVIFAPAVTATLVSLVGLAPSYLVIALLLFGAGISTAAFHAPAPAMVARAAKKRVGLGMSLFMAAGEMGFTVGPLLAVGAVSVWALEGIWRLMFVGWAVSAVLFLRMRGVSAQAEKPGSLRAMFPAVWSVFIPIVFFNLFRNPLVESLSTYLPTFMDVRGAGLWAAGATLALVQFAGIPGALVLGPLSDRIGRKRALLGASLLASTLMLIFLRIEGFLALPVLMLCGAAAFSTLPVLLAMVQERFPSNRSMANGLYMMIMFALRPVGTILVGLLGDAFGLETAYLIAALLSFLTIPAILMMPVTTRT